MAKADAFNELARQHRALRALYDTAIQKITELESKIEPEQIEDEE